MPNKEKIKNDIKDLLENEFEKGLGILKNDLSITEAESLVDLKRILEQVVESENINFTENDLNHIKSIIASTVAEKNVRANSVAMETMVNIFKGTISILIKAII